MAGKHDNVRKDMPEQGACYWRASEEWAMVADRAA